MGLGGLDIFLDYQNEKLKRKGKNMMKRIYRILIISGILSGFFLLLSGCASVPKEADLKESLRLAAENYWKLRLDERFEDTYKMENGQGLPPFEKYRDLARAMKRIRIVSISVKDVSVNEGKGDVDLDWRYTLPKIPKPFNETIKDKWVYKDGNWRHLSYPGAE